MTEEPLTDELELGELGPEDDIETGEFGVGTIIGDFAVAQSNSIFILIPRHQYPHQLRTKYLKYL
jgi:hypothetical protein